MYACPISSAIILFKDVCEHREADLFDDDIGHCTKHQVICVLPKFRLAETGTNYERYEQISGGYVR